MKFYYLEDFDEDKQRDLKTTLEIRYKLNKECWEWTGPRDSFGYGKLGKIVIHRLAYALFVSDFHKSSFICHHCDNPRCYNPRHLYEGNQKTNMQDAVRRGRIHRTRSHIKSDKLTNQKEST